MIYIKGNVTDKALFASVTWHDNMARLGKQAFMVWLKSAVLIAVWLRHTVVKYHVSLPI